MWIKADGRGVWCVLEERKSLNWSNSVQCHHWLHWDHNMGHFSIKQQKQIAVDSIFGIKVEKSMFSNWRIEVVCFLRWGMRLYTVQWFMWTRWSSWMQPWEGRPEDSSARRPHMPVNQKCCHWHTRYWCSFDCYCSIWSNHW